MSEHNYQIIRRFGPSIFKIKIPKDIVDKLNSYVDNLVKDQEKTKKLNYGEYLVGDVTQEFLLEKKNNYRKWLAKFFINMYPKMDPSRNWKKNFKVCT